MMLKSKYKIDLLEEKSILDKLFFKTSYSNQYQVFIERYIKISNAKIEINPANSKQLIFK